MEEAARLCEHAKITREILETRIEIHHPRKRSANCFQQGIKFHTSQAAI